MHSKIMNYQQKMAKRAWLFWHNIERWTRIRSWSSFTG